MGVLVQRRPAATEPKAPANPSAQCADASTTTSPTQQAVREASANVPQRHRTKKKARVPLSLSEWQQLPDYLKDNEYIKRYYRVAYTPKQILMSLFTIHNETGSVWTHLIGVVIFLILTCVTIAARPAPLQLAAEHLSGLEGRLLDGCSDLWRLGKGWAGDASLWDASGQIEQHLSSVREQLEGLLSAAGKEGSHVLQEIEQRVRSVGDARLQDLLAVETWLLHLGKTNLRSLEAGISHALASVVDLQWPAKRWPVHVFTAGAMVCLATSTVCHLFSCCGLKGAEKIWRFDYAGIVVLIVTSFVPVVYYSFLCNSLTRNFYLLTTTGLGILTVSVSLMKMFQSTRYRTFRACLFAGLGLWGVVPGLHALYVFGSATAIQKAMGYDIIMGIIYLAGAAIYAMRIPERWKPGAFDLAFNSHQLFHCAVVIAALLHYRGVKILLHWRDSTGGCAVPFHELVAQNATTA